MKSMKTLSLILVASTLIPASAHAWSWSYLIKPAAAVAVNSTGLILTALCFKQGVFHSDKINTLKYKVQLLNEDNLFSQKADTAFCEFVQNKESNNNNDETPNPDSVYTHPAFIRARAIQLKDRYPKHYQEWKTKALAELATRIKTEQWKSNSYLGVGCTGIALNFVSTAYLLYFLGKPAVNYATNYLSNR